MTESSEIGISEVNIHLVKPNKNLIGFASVVLNKEIYLGSIAIYTRRNVHGYSIGYPKREIGADKVDVYHPITKDLSGRVENAIISKVKEFMGEG